MKSLLEIFINISDLNENQVYDLFGSFCRLNPEFKLNKKKSKEYSRDTNGKAFIIYVIGSIGIESSIVAFAEKTNRILYLTNIVPLNKNQLSLQEYNFIANNFFKKFREYIKKTDTKISIKITKEDIGLREIIPGETTRKLFERYLAMYPLSFHSMDVERFDFFICALFRYRSKIRTYLLKRYLIEDLGWKQEDAVWCINRIETGLDILKVNYKFH